MNTQSILSTIYTYDGKRFFIPKINLEEIENSFLLPEEARNNIALHVIGADVNMVYDNVTRSWKRRLTHKLTSEFMQKSVSRAFLDELTKGNLLVDVIYQNHDILRFTEFSVLVDGVGWIIGYRISYNQWQAAGSKEANACSCSGGCPITVGKQVWPLSKKKEALHAFYERAISDNPALPYGDDSYSNENLAVTKIWVKNWT